MTRAVPNELKENLTFIFHLEISHVATALKLVIAHICDMQATFCPVICSDNNIKC